MTTTARKTEAAPAAAPARKIDKDLPLIQDIRLLGRILGDVIREQEGAPAFELIERIRQLAVAYRLKRDTQAGRALDRLRSSQGNKRSLIERIEPLVRTLTSQLDETAAFFVRDGFAAEALCSATSQQALRYAIDAGQKVPMHAFAGGKALLAGMSVEELDAFFAHAALETFRPNTITDEAHLRAQIAEIRNGGLAVTREEYTPGIHGFAVPVIEETRTIGAISVAVPAARATEALELRIAALLQRTADLIAAQ